MKVIASNTSGIPESHRRGLSLSLPLGTAADSRTRAARTPGTFDDCPEFRQLPETSPLLYLLVASFSMTYKRRSNCTVSGARFQRDQMLRIQREANGQVLLKISGRLDGENLAQLKELIESDKTDRRILLDLRELTLVDQNAVRFLSQCEANGIELKNCPPYICEWIARQRDGN